MRISVAFSECTEYTYDIKLYFTDYGCSWSVVDYHGEATAEVTIEEYFEFSSDRYEVKWVFLLTLRYKTIFEQF
jgi:hypothetical protein